MSRARQLLFAATGIAAAGAIYIAVSFVRYQSKMRQIAKELHMPGRSFSAFADPIEPMQSAPGDERLLVVGRSQDDYLIASIVRNRRYDDLRSQWKVDLCVRRDANGKIETLPIWDRLDRFPTQKERERFRRLALQEEWLVWDSPLPQALKASEESLQEPSTN